MRTEGKYYLVQADALVICPENSEGLYAGSEVTAFLLY